MEELYKVEINLKLKYLYFKRERKKNSFRLTLQCSFNNVNLRTFSDLLMYNKIRKTEFNRASDYSTILLLNAFVLKYYIFLRIQINNLKFFFFELLLKILIWYTDTEKNCAIRWKKINKNYILLSPSSDICNFPESSYVLIYTY